MKLNTIIKNIGLVVYSVVVFFSLHLLQVAFSLITYVSEAESATDGLVIASDIIAILFYISIICALLISFFMMRQKRESFLMMFQSGIVASAIIYIILFIFNIILGYIQSSIFGLLREFLFFGCVIYLVTLFVTQSGAICMLFNGNTSYLDKAIFKIKVDDIVIPSGPQTAPDLVKQDVTEQQVTMPVQQIASQQEIQQAPPQQ